IEYPWSRAVTAREAARLIGTSGGTEFTATGPAPTAASLTWARAGALEMAWLKFVAALLRATAPISAGPIAKPKSRTMLVVAAAMPASRVGTVLTTVAVTDETAKEKPTPTSPIGTISEGSVAFVIGRVEAQICTSPIS